ncbi:MAG: hypothetical protein M3373_07965 [Gemmatimonadota bacterium]|nr:hypothetical protein [Gemmatimonadota bacterium]
MRTSPLTHTHPVRVGLLARLLIRVPEGDDGYHRSALAAGVPHDMEAVAARALRMGTFTPSRGQETIAEE